MQKGEELYKKKLERVFHELGESIFGFFDFHSLMQSLTVSRDFYHLLNQYFKSFLVKNNLIEGKQKAATEDEDYYLKLFRSFYSRETLVGQLSSIKQSCQELQLVRYPRCSTYGVKDFSIGNKFTVFHLFNNDILFLKSEEYLNPLFNMKNINLKNIRKNVTKFSTKGKDLLYLTNAGHLHVVFHNPELASHLFSEGTLQLTVEQPLKDFEASYSQALLLIKGSQSSPQKKIQKNEEHKEEKEGKENFQDIRYLSLHNLTIEDLNAPERIKKVEGLDNQEIASLCVGSNTAYLIGDNWRVFECDLSVMNNDKYVIFPYEGLKGRVIRKLWCGHSFYFALEQNEIASIEDWSQEEILKWVSSWKDFEEFVNIVKYENISGKELIEADKEFLVDRLGMMREDLQVKFLNEIDKVSKKTFKKPKLYSWGKNDFGQLGLNASNVIVNHPHGVALPELEKGDQIKHVECGWRSTAIITQEGRVWMTEVPAKKAPQKEKEVEEQPEKREKGKKKKKESVEIPEEKKVEKPATPWVDLSGICGTLKDGRKYKLIKVSLSKDHFAVLGANLGQKLNQKGEEKGGKFKGADHIFKRIMWDESFKIEEFVVGYEDRFLGILEIPFAEFSLKTDIPLHRIKFFKRNGEVVWDRASKATSL